jgi:hypothetical protein
MSGIVLSSYPVLSTYAIVAQSGLTTVDPTVVNDGYYGSTGGTITGTFVPSGSPSGNNQANLATANTEITQLVLDIATFTSGLPSTLISGGTGAITYSPGINYNSASSIVYNNATLTFDAQGDTNAQFYFTAGSTITFSNVTMTLANGAQQCNIFWLAQTAAITFTTIPDIYGVFIAGSAITSATATNFNAHLYTQTGGSNISFSGPTRVNASCTVICFMKGTRILTSAGYVLVEDLAVEDSVVTKGIIRDNSSVDSHQNNRSEAHPIVWKGNFSVTHFTSASFPVCIKAHALGLNTPFQDLYVSPNHRVVCRGYLMTAYGLMNGRTIYQDRTRKSVDYYHIELEKHSVIDANGVLSETYVDLGSRNIFGQEKASSSVPASFNISHNNEATNLSYHLVFPSYFHHKKK